MGRYGRYARKGRAEQKKEIRCVMHEHSRLLYV